MLSTRQTKQSQKTFTENQIASSHGKHVYYLQRRQRQKKTCLMYLKLHQVKRQMFAENQISSSHLCVYCQSNDIKSNKTTFAIHQMTAK